MSKKNNDGCGMLLFIVCVVGLFISIVSTIKQNTSDSIGYILFDFLVLFGIGYLIYSTTKKSK